MHCILFEPATYIKWLFSLIVCCQATFPCIPNESNHFRVQSIEDIHWIFLNWTCFVHFCTGAPGKVQTGLCVQWEFYHLPVPTHTLTKDSHNTKKFMPYSSQTVCGFFIELIKIEGICETGPIVYSPYLRRLSEVNFILHSQRITLSQYQNTTP